METKLLKKFIVKIPKNVFVFFSKNNNLVILGPFGLKSLQLTNKIIVSNSRKSIFVTDLPFFKSSFLKTKTFKDLQKTYIILLKQKINEVLITVKKRLNLVGIGYRVSITEISSLQILQLKLGFSHSIYFKIPKKLTVICPTPTKILIFGSCQQSVDKMSSLIKSYKIPDIYKGKGILYNNEKIVLKEGKKV